jgi:hypothetical protein
MSIGWKSWMKRIKSSKYRTNKSSAKELCWKSSGKGGGGTNYKYFRLQ